MRDVYRRTRPLPLVEWQQFWAFEHINFRGVVTDMPFVRRAAILAAEDAIASGRRLITLTDGVVTKVTQAQRIATWLHDTLPDAAMREALTVGAPADDDDDSDEEAEPPEFGLTRDRVGRVLAMLEAKRANGGLDPAEIKAHEVATLRLTAPGPRQKSSRASQNSKSMAYSAVNTASPALARLGAYPRGARKSRIWLVMCSARTAPPRPRWSTPSRTAAVTPRWPRRNRSMSRWRASSLCSCVLLWPGLGKYSSGVTRTRSKRGPRLGSRHRKARKRSSTFFASMMPIPPADIYTLAAADILHVGSQAITKIERGIGKVACLSLAFGGSVGALQRMALSYRIHLDDAEARRIVTAWRDANLWAREFWGAHRDEESFGLWGAAMRAWETPGEITAAGRLAFVYREDYLGGCLFMGLPSGRLLSYPRPRWRDVNILDKDGKPTGEKRHELSFQRAHGRTKLWHGPSRKTRPRQRLPTFCAKPSPGSRPTPISRSCRFA